MKFSTRAEYGLMAMINLAKSYPAIKPSKEISFEEGLSSKYTERLIGDLRKHHLVKSFKGKEGGYRLIKIPRDIKIGQIVEALEGPIAAMGCNDKQCLRNQCTSSKVWLTLEKQIRKTLYSMKLSDLI